MPPPPSRENTSVFREKNNSSINLILQSVEQLVKRNTTVDNETPSKQRKKAKLARAPIIGNYFNYSPVYIYKKNYFFRPVIMSYYGL